MTSFLYVQRLEAAHGKKIANPFGAQPNASQILLDTGADVEFGWMGKWEYEDSRTPNSLARIWTVANTIGMTIIQREIATPTYTGPVYILATEEQEREVLPAWERWIENGAPTARETYFPGTEHANPGGNDTLAWHAIEADLIWAKDLSVAQRILGSLIDHTDKDTE